MRNGIKDELIKFIVKECKKEKQRVDGDTIKLIIKYFENKRLNEI